MPVAPPGAFLNAASPVDAPDLAYPYFRTLTESLRSWQVASKSATVYTDATSQVACSLGTTDQFRLQLLRDGDKVCLFDLKPSTGVVTFVYGDVLMMKVGDPPNTWTYPTISDVITDGTYYVIPDYATRPNAYCVVTFNSDRSALYSIFVHGCGYMLSLYTMPGTSAERYCVRVRGRLSGDSCCADFPVLNPHMPFIYSHNPITELSYQTYPLSPLYLPLPDLQPDTFDFTSGSLITGPSIFQF